MELTLSSVRAFSVFHWLWSWQSSREEPSIDTILRIRGHYHHVCEWLPLETVELFSVDTIVLPRHRWRWCFVDMKGEWLGQPQEEGKSIFPPTSMDRSYFVLSRLFHWLWSRQLSCIEQSVDVFHYHVNEWLPVQIVSLFSVDSWWNRGCDELGRRAWRERMFTRQQEVVSWQWRASRPYKKRLTNFVPKNQNLLLVFDCEKWQSSPSLPITSRFVSTKYLSYGSEFLLMDTNLILLRDSSIDRTKVRSIFSGSKIIKTLKKSNLIDVIENGSVGLPTPPLPLWHHVSFFIRTIIMTFTTILI